MIRYLEGKEKVNTRGLWREAFGEGSESFKDYYYSEKVKDNRILVWEDQGRIDAMVQLNPYLLQVRDRRWRVDYLVGVAMREECRHHGYMRRLLCRAMTDMRQELMPFCFLMPANEAIYRPFGFTYIFDQPQVQLAQPSRVLGRQILPWLDIMGGPWFLDALSDWINSWISQSCQVYAVRSEAYLLRLFKELESENGSFNVIYDGNVMVGVLADWGWQKREQRLLYAKPDYVMETGAAKPAIMARIITPEIFMRVIHLSADAPEEMEIRLQISDPLIPENDGLWRWCLNHEASWLLRPERGMDGGAPELVLTIDELTSWLFGYGVPEAAGAYRDRIEPLRGVFLDEVV